MSGGTLDADETLTVSGALTQTADIAIDVATGKTLTYSGAAVNLGAKTLLLLVWRRNTETTPMPLCSTMQTANFT